MKKLFGIIACLLAIVAAGVYAAGDDDVYNFYFQKGPAPQTVIQGGAGQRAAQAPPPQQALANPIAAPAPVETALPTAVSTPPPAAELTANHPSTRTEEKHLEYQRYNLFLGENRISDEVGTGLSYSFGGQYNFNKYIGARLLAHVLAVETADYTAPITDRDQAANRLGASLALVITPLYLELFGHQLLRVSALGGVMTQRKFATQSDDGSPSNVNIDARGFLGAAAALSINENFGLEASVAMLDGDRIGNAIGSMVFSF